MDLEFHGPRQGYANLEATILEHLLRAPLGLSTSIHYWKIGAVTVGPSVELPDTTNGVLEVSVDT